MANSRLYLIHKSSNTGIYLMKNAGGEWFPGANTFEDWQSSIMKWADMSGINYDNHPELSLSLEEDLPANIKIIQ